VAAERRTAHARVQVTLDFEVDGTWGPDCTVKQIHTQATEEALCALRRGCVINGTTINSNSKVGVRVVGAPTITAVLTEV
jgi:hypothetical protein